ncbi:MAG TPA: hypothetical protein ENK10_00305 [Acidobacteria bacterium]|nr:hypothetical protein [Acidobacteriota bacterium]
MTPDLAPSLGQGVQVIAALAVVLALIVIFGYLARRGGLRGGGRTLRVEQRLTLGRGAQLALVVAEGRRLLVGVSEQQITLVSDLGRDDEDAETAEAEQSVALDAPPQPRVMSFARELTRRLRHGEVGR